MGILASVCSLLGCAPRPKANADYRRVDVEAFAAALSDSDVMLLDVRTAAEYAEGHIARAQNIDVLQPDFERRVTTSLPCGTRVALYCRSGGRSQQAAAILLRRGYGVVDLSAGFLGWEAAGRPSVSGKGFD